jgi:hypothetical protein
VLRWEATHDMRGLSGWYGAASGVWNMWTVSLLRTALGQEQLVAASKSGRSSKLRGVPPIDRASLATMG